MTKQASRRPCCDPGRRGNADKARNYLGSQRNKMLPGILGTKVGMTHIFTADGKMIPVTVIHAGPVFVTQIKTTETDGYSAVQVGFGKKSDKLVSVWEPNN